MKQSRRYLSQFESDLNQLETPPHRSITNSYEILIKTKDYLEQKILQTFGKSSIYTRTLQTTTQMDKLTLDNDFDQRNIRARTIDQFPQELKVDSQLRAVHQKKMHVKDKGQFKQNPQESSQSHSTLRRDSNSLQQKSILKKHSIRDSSHSSQKRSISSHSGKSVRFCLVGSSDLKKFMNFGK